MAGSPVAGVDQRRDHVVKVYDDDQDLLDAVGRFIATGFAAGDLVVVVATAQHRHALEQLPTVDLAGALATGRYLALDADETAHGFMVDGSLDADRFRTVIGGLITGAAPRRVRIFGEMVAVLWDEGNVDAAIQLEALWNDLARDHSFSLYCAYALSALGNGAALDSIRQVCQHHTEVVAPGSYGTHPVAQPGSGEPSSMSELFVPVPLSIGSARRFVDRILAAWGEVVGAREDAAVVVSELATNAVRHAGSPFRVSVSRRGSTVRISVRDAGPGRPELGRASPDMTNGRGLALVAALCSSWGVDPVADGKVVWADIAA